MLNFSVALNQSRIGFAYDEDYNGTLKIPLKIYRSRRCLELDIRDTT
jgi:hypothetical protein